MALAGVIEPRAREIEASRGEITHQRREINLAVEPGFDHIVGRDSHTVAQREKEATWTPQAGGRAGSDDVAGGGQRDARRQILDQLGAVEYGLVGRRVPPRLRVDTRVPAAQADLLWNGVLGDECKGRMCLAGATGLTLGPLRAKSRDGLWYLGIHRPWGSLFGGEQIVLRKRRR